MCDVTTSTTSTTILTTSIIPLLLLLMLLSPLVTKSGTVVLSLSVRNDKLDGLIEIEKQKVKSGVIVMISNLVVVVMI